MTENSICNSIIKSAKSGYAYHRIILDDTGTPSDYEFLYVNPAFETITGLKSENIINRRAAEVIPGFLNDNSDWLGICGSTALGMSDKEVEIYFRQPDKYFQAQLFSTDKYFFVSVFNDFSGKRKAEKELDDSDKLLKTITDNIIDLIALTDLKGNFLYAGKSHEILGYGIEFLLGKNVMDFVHPEDLSRVQDEFSRMTDDSKVEYRYRCADETYLWFQTEGKVLKDNNNKPYQLIFSTRDITELKTSRMQLSGALEIADLGYWEYDVEKDLFTFNDQFYKIYHTSAEREGGYLISSSRYASRFLHPEDINVFKESSRLAAETADPDLTVKTEHRIIYPDRSTGYISVQFFIEKDSRGKTVKTYGVNQNITEQKNTEIVLKESEERFRNIFQNNNAIMLLIEPETGNILDANKAASEFYGYTIEQLCGMKMHEINLLDDKKLAYYRKLATEGKTNYFSFNHRISNGDIKSVEVYTSPIFVNSKKNIFSIIHDITERKKAEKELEKAKSLLEQTSRIARIGGWETNLVSGDAVWSLVKKEIYEVPSDYVPDIDNTINFYRKGLDRNAVKEMVKQAIETGKPYDIEAKIVTAKGRELWVRTIGNAEFQDGRCVRLYGTTQDIDDRKNAEEEQIKLQAQLNQSHKMESVGRLAGGVAHDFNNMLGVIIGHSEMAMEQSELAEPVLEDLKEIHKAARHSAELTRQLLAFARKQTVTPKVLDLNEIIEGMLKILKRLIGENIKLVRNLYSEECTVKMDSFQIDQIITNLCINARDAINSIGIITITTEYCTLDEAACRNKPEFFPGEYVILSVRDNGCGMDKEIMDKLFEPFFTTKEVGLGTGLGLPTVYGIVKQNNGFIDVESTPGSGSLFKIYLPGFKDDKKEANPLNKNNSVSEKHTGETILLVEDEPSILDMTKSILERLGYNVIPAESPGEAIRKSELKGSKINLLLSDVIMPEMNGRDLAIELLLKNPKLKCLFMSGYTADIISRQGMLGPGVNFIQKPFSLKELANKVRSVLDNT